MRKRTFGMTRESAATTRLIPARYRASLRTSSAMTPSRKGCGTATTSARIAEPPRCFRPTRTTPSTNLSSANSRRTRAGPSSDARRGRIRLALGAHPVVQAENVASTHLASPFRPPLAGPDDDVASVIDAASVTDTGSSKGGAVYHKMVDCVLVLDTDLTQSASDAAIYLTLAPHRVRRRATPYRAVDQRDPVRGVAILPDYPCECEGRRMPWLPPPKGQAHEADLRESVHKRLSLVWQQES
ncbi:hypothetical protein B0T17DRAFT_149218 [Bombardia bombarda]|uniref:Uncharacterized protein n=1 Tax=Bombardia bombarda TaxID=252184 RepID=A0AA39X7C6_9PEZI|nr:hypothetical protein B0T17DRAFT_149218 [Bombardia bombarda]